MTQVLRQIMVAARDIQEEQGRSSANPFREFYLMKRAVDEQGEMTYGLEDLDAVFEFVELFRHRIAYVFEGNDDAKDQQFIDSLNGTLRTATDRRRMVDFLSNQPIEGMPVSLDEQVQNLANDMMGAVWTILNAIDRSAKDPLTDVYSRYHFENVIFNELRSRFLLSPGGEEQRIEIANGSYVLFLDLDHFGMVNKLYGMKAGDKFLKYFAKRFSHLLRGYDAFVRLGGEEFIVVFEDISPADLRSALQRLVDELNLWVVMDEDGEMEMFSFDTAEIGESLSVRGVEAGEVNVYEGEADGKAFRSFAMQPVDEVDCTARSCEAGEARVFERDGKQYIAVRSVTFSGGVEELSIENCVLDGDNNFVAADEANEKAIGAKNSGRDRVMVDKGEFILPNRPY